MYQLSSSVVGHKADVLSLAVTVDDCIVSCSRDQTTKLWKSNSLRGQFVEAENYFSEYYLSCKYQTCVCVLPPSDLFEHGLVITGGNDNRIFVYETNNSVPIRQLRAHSNSVCKIARATEPNVFLSASWDATVKMWQISDTDFKCILTIESHSVSVWAVLQMKRKYILTGSADKLIRVFDSAGRLIKLLSGHEDCVRDLVEINDDEILSCSNDTTVRRWSVSTCECLEIFYGHPNYVYSVRILGDLIISSGEGSCLLIWSGGKHLQTITLPARSVWAIDIMSNNDIVAGTSDGVIRIFTADEKRVADENILKEFIKGCADVQVSLKNFLASAKLPHLPGPEILSEPGTNEGQTRFVLVSGKVTCYSWSLAEKTWKKLSHVEVNERNTKIFGTNSVAARKGKKNDSKDTKELFICAVCKRTFSRKYSLHKHIEVKKHSVANEIPPYLVSVLPRTHLYYVLNYRRKGSNFKTELCLPAMNSINDLREWIRCFAELNKCLYVRKSIKRCPHGTCAYSEFYRCQHASSSKTTGIKKRSSKDTGCRSTIHGAIKRDQNDDSCYGKMNITFVHNHSVEYSFKYRKPTPEVEDMFRLMYYDGMNPGNALRTYKKHLQFQSPQTYSVLLLDRSICPNYDWVRRFYQKLQQDADGSKNIAANEESGANESTELLDVDVVNDNNGFDLVNFDGERIEEMILEVEVGDDRKTNTPRVAEKLLHEFDIFVDKLREDPSYYGSGIASMCRELEMLDKSTAEKRLTALQSFNKVSDIENRPD